jgi:4-coumarate--CoA ligase
VFLLEDDNGKKHSVWELVGDEEYEPVVLNGDETKDQVALMCFSSGTTGSPKGVNSSHFNTTSVIKQFTVINREQWTPRQIYACTNLFDFLRFPRNQCVATGFLPMYHMYAVMMFLYAGPHHGLTTLVLPGFKLDLYLSTIQKYRVTVSLVIIFLSARSAWHLRSIRRVSHKTRSIKDWPHR